ncbi:hypothetical protein [Jeotgalibaca porci]|uniref:hypothetical protein n=1 Tax=Jeotgalibaca porci TaxID=1868793 RepID=UPI00359F1A38
MQLTIKDHNQFGTLTILSIDLSGETEQELLKLEHDLAIGNINQKQYKLKILSTILRGQVAE